MNDLMQAVLNSIKDLAGEASFSERFFEHVLRRLASFAYPLKTEDAWLIYFCSQKVENAIKNACNVSSVPEGLLQVAVDRVCAEFLVALKQTGQLELESLDLSAAVTQVREGDITVSFAQGVSNDDKFMQYMNMLLKRGESEFVCFRRIKW